MFTVWYTLPSISVTGEAGGKGVGILSLLQESVKLKKKKKDSEIMTTLLTSAGVTKKVAATTLKHDVIARHNCSDWDFLLNRAKANGMVVFNSLGVVDVKVPKIMGSEKVSVTYGKDIKTFRGDLDASSQLQQVEGINYDIYNEKVVKQTGKDPKFDKPGINVSLLNLVITPNSFLSQLRKSSSSLLVPLSIRTKNPFLYLRYL